MPAGFLKPLLGVLSGMFLLLSAQAEEKNGLMVNITKKTLDRVDDAVNARTEKTQGLGVTVKNTSIRDFPEGEVSWTILVRKANDTTLYKYTGKEVLKALRPASSAELIFGAAQTSGYRNYASSRDKLEYEVIINHAGKETIRMSSDNNFAILSKRAVLLGGEEEVAPAITVVPNPPGPEVVPGKPGMPKPSDPPMPGTPAAPGRPADPNAPANPNAPVVPEAAPGQPFDFFNLEKKK